MRHELMPGGDHDLPTRSITIDRLLKNMLDRDRAELYGIAEVITSRDDALDRRLPDGWARFQLSPDLVALGDARLRAG